MPAPYRTIACCIDGDPSAGRVLAEAHALQAPGAGPLVAIHVVALPHALVAGPFAYHAPCPVLLVRPVPA